MGLLSWRRKRKGQGESCAQICAPSARKIGDSHYRIAAELYELLRQVANPKGQGSISDDQAFAG